MLTFNVSFLLIATTTSLSALVIEVNSTNHAVEELLLDQKSDLQNKLSALVLFRAEKDKFSHWVDEMREKLMEEQEIHGDASEWNKLLDEVKVCCVKRLAMSVCICVCAKVGVLVVQLVESWAYNPEDTGSNPGAGGGKDIKVLQPTSPPICKMICKMGTRSCTGEQSPLAVSH